MQEMQKAAWLLAQGRLGCGWLESGRREPPACCSAPPLRLLIHPLRFSASTPPSCWRRRIVGGQLCAGLASVAAAALHPTSSARRGLLCGLNAQYRLLLLICGRRVSPRPPLCRFDLESLSTPAALPRPPDHHPRPPAGAFRFGEPCLAAATSPWPSARPSVPAPRRPLAGPGRKSRPCSRGSGVGRSPAVP